MRELWIVCGIVLSMMFMASIAGLPPAGAIVANAAPRWDAPTAEFRSSDVFRLDLSRAFFDADGDVLSFRVEPSLGVTAGLSGNTLIVYLESAGGTVDIVASDGKVQVSQRIVVYR